MDQINRNESLSAGERYSADSEHESSTFDTVKNTVADRLHDAATTIQEKVGRSQNSSASGYANQAAGWLDDASSYIRGADAQKVKADVKDQVRRNPGRSLLIAGAAGLLLGILLRR